MLRPPDRLENRLVRSMRARIQRTFCIFCMGQFRTVHLPTSLHSSSPPPGYMRRHPSSIYCHPETLYLAHHKVKSDCWTHPWRCIMYESESGWTYFSSPNTVKPPILATVSYADVSHLHCRLPPTFSSDTHSTCKCSNRGPTLHTVYLNVSPPIGSHTDISSRPHSPKFASCTVLIDLIGDVNTALLAQALCAGCVPTFWHAYQSDCGISEI